MNFHESIEYLYGLGNEVSAMKLGLDNIKTLLAALGNPEKNYIKIQIAGTNGKGSTCAFLEAICLSARIKTGMTTSPHLISIVERVKIGGREIAEKDFARHAATVKAASEKLVAEKKLETVPTFFEQVTAIALNAFAEARVELAILETGLGGRFDATTAALAEIIAVTPIDFDHEQILGNTLTEIAAEKAAIIRGDTRVIVASQQNEAERAILGKCREVGVAPVRATENIQIKIQGAEHGFPYLTACFTTEKGNYPDVILGLQGRHQTTNAATAIALAETLGEFGYKISNNDIWIGLQNAEHKGRLEFCANILFDGAHNVSGATALKNYLDEFVKRPITMIFGAMNDKNLREIAAILYPKADKIIFTKPDNSRSLETIEMIRFLPNDFEEKNVFQTRTVAEALNLAEEVSIADHLICVTGSLYLVGEAQNELKKCGRL